MEKQIRENAAEKDRFLTEMTDNKAEIDRLNREIREVSGQRDSLLSSLSVVSEEKSTSESVLKQFEGTVEGLKREINAIKGENERKIKEIQWKLDAEREKVEKLTVESEKKNEDLQKTGERLEEKIEIVQREKENYRNSVESLNFELLQSKNTVKSLLNEQERLIIEGNQLRLEVEMLKNTEKQLNFNLLTAEKEKIAKETDHKAEILDLQQKIEQQLTEIAQKNENIQLILEEKGKIDQISTEKRSFLEIQIENLTKDKENLQKVIFNIQSDLEKSKNEQNSLLIRLKDMSDSVSQTESTLSTQLSNSKIEIETLKLDISAGKTKFDDEIIENQRKIAKLEAELAGKQRNFASEIEILTENLNLAKETVKNLSEKLSFSQISENSLKESIISIEEKLAKTTSQKIDIEKALKTELFQVQQSKNEEISQISSKNATLTDENIDLQSKLTLKTDECSQLSGKYGKIMLDLNEITNKYTAQLHTIESLSEQLRSFTARNITSELTISSLTDENSTLKSELSRLTSEIASLKDQITENSRLFSLPEVVMKPDDPFSPQIREIDLAAGLDSSGLLDEDPEYPPIITSKSQTGELRLNSTDGNISLKNTLQKLVETVTFDHVEIEIQGKCLEFLLKLDSLQSKVEKIQRKIAPKAREETEEAQGAPQPIGTICLGVEFEGNQWILEKIGSDFLWKDRYSSIDPPVFLSTSLLTQIQALSSEIREKTIQMDESEELHLLKTQEYDKIKQMLTERGFNFQGQTLLSVVNSALMASKRPPGHHPRAKRGVTRAGGSNEFSDLALGSESGGVSADSSPVKRPSSSVPRPDSSNHSSDSMALSESEATSLFATIDKLRRENDDLLRTIDDYERQLTLLKQKMREKDGLAAEPVSGTELSTVVQNLFEVLPLQ